MVSPVVNKPVTMKKGLGRTRLTINCLYLNLLTLDR